MYVLAYHSVFGYPTPRKYVVAPDRFERQLRWLSEHREVIDIRSLDLRAPKPDQVVITFDDGYRDNFEMVFPLAKKFRTPIAIFLATAFIGKEMTLGGELRAMLENSHIQEMYASGLVYFGCHTHNHLLLDQSLDPNFVREDLSRSCSVIDELLGYKPTFFVYPKGRYSDALRPIVEEHFSYAFRGKGALTRFKDPLQIPRIEINGGESRIKEWLKMHPSRLWI